MLVFVLSLCRRAVLTASGCRPGAGFPGSAGSSDGQPVLFSSVGEILCLKTLVSKKNTFVKILSIFIFLFFCKKYRKVLYF